MTSLHSYFYQGDAASESSDILTTSNLQMETSEANMLN